MKKNHGQQKRVPSNNFKILKGKNENFDTEIRSIKRTENKCKF